MLNNKRMMKLLIGGIFLLIIILIGLLRFANRPNRLERIGTLIDYQQMGEDTDGINIYYMYNSDFADRESFLFDPVISYYNKHQIDTDIYIIDLSMVVNQEAIADFEGYRPSVAKGETVSDYSQFKSYTFPYVFAVKNGKFIGDTTDYEIQEIGY